MDIDRTDPGAPTVRFNHYEAAALGLQGCESVAWFLADGGAATLLRRAELMHDRYMGPDNSGDVRHPHSSALWARSVAHAMDAIVVLQSADMELTEANIRGAKSVAFDKNTMLSQAS